MMMQQRVLGLHCRRIVPSAAERLASSSSKTQKHLKWTERDEAPKWLKRMAPTKGGTALPTLKESLVIAVVAGAGYYAWFVDPPKEQER